jgi:hypothetical protein
MRRAMGVQDKRVPSKGRFVDASKRVRSSRLKPRCRDKRPEARHSQSFLAVADRLFRFIGRRQRVPQSVGVWSNPLASHGHQ